MVELPVSAHDPAPATIVDPVTGAYTRDLFEARFSKELARARRSGAELSVCLLDVDHFKTINDAFGHARGDHLLRSVVDRVQAVIRESDWLFRYGGDEFVMLLPDTDAAGAFELAQRIVRSMAETLLDGDPPLTLSVSIGVATFPADAGDATGLLATADSRSYLAKRRGRGRAVADDAAASGTTGPSRMIERDAELAAATSFIQRLLEHGEGAFVVRGERGAGHTRFVEEIAKIAGLHGLEVQTAATADWPPPAYRRPTRAAAAQRAARRTRQETRGVLVVADGAGAWSVAQERVAALLAADQPPTAVGMVLAGPGSGTHRVPVTMPLLGAVDLAPFSPSAMRVWLRTAVQGEPTGELVDWVATRSGGLPARAERALARLVDTGALEQIATGGWALAAAAGTAAPPVQPWLPTMLTDFVGRACECEQVEQLLAHSRLVTLVGPGGIGKTRLSLAVAGGLHDHFAHGVVFVPLAEATTVQLVESAIARSLGVVHTAGQPVADAIADQLRDQRMLLVLDNFEQVLDAAPFVAELLSAAPGLTVLTSSRERLRLSGERVYAVPPLTLPTVDELALDTSAVAAAIAASSALALFAARAKAANYAFELHPGNLRAVVELCTRLDALPLAIELAAARIDTLTAEQLLEQLGRRPDLMTEGPRDVPARQQTLRAAIDWSVDRLDARDADTFALLGVFAGGCSLAAARAVCADDDVAQRLARLTDASLLRMGADPSGAPRYEMLETTHAYAAERLAADPAASAAAHARHAIHFAAFAEQANVELRGPDRIEWLAQVETEYANLRVALDWGLDNGAVETAARTALGLYRFWYNGNHVAESRPWLERVLGAAGELSPRLRMQVLDNAAWLAISEGDHGPGRLLATQCLEAARQVDDQRIVAETLCALGDIDSCTGAHYAARAHYEAALQICQQTGDRPGIAMALGSLAEILCDIGDLDGAATFGTEALALEREADHARGVVEMLTLLGRVALLRDDIATARTALREGLELSRTDGHLVAEVRATLGLARVADRAGSAPEAVRLALAALATAKRLGFRIELATTIEGLAAIIVASRPRLAATLFGAAEELRERHGLPRPPALESAWSGSVARLRGALSDGTLAGAWSTGRAGRLDQVLDEALALNPATCRA